MEPCCGWNLPEEQLTQAVDAAAATVVRYVPAAHGVHANLAPVVLMKVPTGQAAQESGDTALIQILTGTGVSYEGRFVEVLHADGDSY